MIMKVTGKRIVTLVALMTLHRNTLQYILWEVSRADGINRFSSGLRVLPQGFLPLQRGDINYFIWFRSTQRSSEKLPISSLRLSTKEAVFDHLFGFLLHQSRYKSYNHRFVLKKVTRTNWELSFCVQVFLHHNQLEQHIQWQEWGPGLFIHLLLHPTINHKQDTGTLTTDTYAHEPLNNTDLNEIQIL